MVKAKSQGLFIIEIIMKNYKTTSTERFDNNNVITFVVFYA